MRGIKSPDIASNTEAFWKRAKDGTRTRDPNLGKVMLYQLSYFRNKMLCKCCAKQISKSCNHLIFRCTSINEVLEAGIFEMQSSKTVFSCNLFIINRYLSV